MLDTAAAMRPSAPRSARRPGAGACTASASAGSPSPQNVIDCGNSGTGVRLIMGAMATRPSPPPSPATPACAAGRWAGSPSRWRCSARGPCGRSGGRLPLTLVGAADPVPVRYRLPVASAQVKSAVLLAGLNAPGETVVIEPRADARPYRADAGGLRRRDRGRGRRPRGGVITLTGRPELRPQTIAVPRDPSSAAFPVCGRADRAEGSDVLVPAIGLNPTRAGLYETLLEMGADLDVRERARGGRRAGGRPARRASRRCRASRCRPSARRR